MARIILILFGVLLTSSVFAQVPTDNALNQIVGAYQTASAGWESTIRTYALGLFWLLVAIDFSWGAIKLALEKSEFDSFWAFMVTKIMTIGFFLALIQFGSGWSATIIDSMRQVAGAAGGSTTVNPSEILDQGLYVAVTLIERSTGILQPGDTIIAGLLGIGILAIYALIAAELIFVLVSMWIILYAGIIMLGFGGSQWTRDYAINYYKTVLAIATKLFVIQLLVGIGQAIVSNWANQLSENPQFAEMFVIAGGVLVLYILVKNIGGLVESLITGSGAASTSGSGAVVAAAAGAAAAVAGMATAGASVAQQATGMGQAASAANTLAAMNQAENGPSGFAQSMANLGESIAGDAGRSVGQSLGGAFDRIAGATQEMGAAYAEDYGARASGDFSAMHGTSAGRMGNIMQDKIAGKEMAGGDGGSPSPAENYVSGVPDTDQS